MSHGCTVAGNLGSIYQVSVDLASEDPMMDKGRITRWLDAAMVVLENSVNLVRSSEAISTFTDNFGHAYSLLVLAEEEHAKLLYCLNFAFGDSVPTDEALRNLRNHEFKQVHIHILDRVYEILEASESTLGEYPATESLADLLESGEISDLYSPLLAQGFAEILSEAIPDKMRQISHLAEEEEELEESGKKRAKFYNERKNSGLYVDLDGSGRTEIFNPSKYMVEDYQEKLASRCRCLHLLLLALRTDKGQEVYSQEGESC